MSNPVGASNRQDLFTPMGKSTFDRPPTTSARLASPASVAVATARNDNDDPIELEHVIGYTGHHSSTMFYHPMDSDTYISCMGACVVIGKVSEAHNQEFLRGHDEEVCCVAVSSSGVLMASAQLPSSQGNAVGAPVVVWEYETRRMLYQLNGFQCKITRMAFSPDDHFLVASGEDCRMVLWDMRTSEVVLTKMFPAPINLLAWGRIDESSRRAVYTLAFSHSSQVIMNDLAYDISCMQYALKSYPCGMPSTGLVRDYLCGTLTHSLDNVLGGTLAGEMVIFNAETRVFRCTVPVSSNGVHSIVACNQTGHVFAGTGDGMINKLVGANAEWSLTAQVRVVGQVVSLSISSDGSELLAGTSAGKSYRVLACDLSVSELSSSHIAPVMACAFGTQSDLFASISQDGTIRVWDLSDYSVLAMAQETVAGLSLCFMMPKVGYTPITTLISGWNDGCIRAYNAASGEKIWSIANAHRGQVLSVAAGDKFVASGSSDGGVSVWSAFTRELVAQFHEHKRAVTKVLVDNTHPNLVHSCGLDRGVYTYDLKTERRTIGHQVREGGFNTMSQRIDSEQELVTGGCDGRILFWDCDVTDYVLQLNDPSKLKINQVNISPSGKYLITCGDDCQVKLFDMRNNQLISCCLGHSDIVHDATWSPDERQIISVGNDACICVWSFFGDI